MPKFTITNYSIANDHKHGTSLYLWLERYDYKEKVKKELVYITESDALQMTNFNKTYKLSTQNVDFRPANCSYRTSYFKNDNFDSILGLYMQFILKVGHITKQQYIDFCVAHLNEYYCTTYYNSNCLLRSFFSNYFPIKIRQKYSDCFAMLEAHKDDIAKGGARSHWETIPGRVIGFYHDSYYDKDRPITSRVEHVQIFNDVDRLKICLQLELPDPEPTTEVKPENETKPENESEGKPENEAKPENESEAKPENEAKSENESEAKPENEGKPENETKPENESEAKPESCTDAV